MGKLSQEVILNYRENSVREKIASKSLKAFLGAGRTGGKFTGTIINKKTDGYHTTQF
jgi:hypothetical protein